MKHKSTSGDFTISSFIQSEKYSLRMPRSKSNRGGVIPFPSVDRHAVDVVYTE